MAMKEISIKGICRCDKARRTALVLDSPAGWKLRIVLNREEAHRIATELQIESNRSACWCYANSLYAVIESLLLRTGAGITGVVLDTSARNMVVARLQMRTGAVETSAPCRTADALALAIRLHAPVFATETLVKLVEARGVINRQDPLPTDAEAAPWLDTVKPEDFVP